MATEFNLPGLRFCRLYASGLIGLD
ncbi:BnaC02g34320D [Brassica napus]|uniref:BnaC02g34320D protein n=1 Tax=Brassica napus TaxID=3708 RepID=A0A078FTX3_BRANA|nr:BnaC02g34320D [Brassica napus]